MKKKMFLMLAAVSLVFAGVFGYHVFAARMSAKYMSRGLPPVVVTSGKAVLAPWQPQLNAVGSLRARLGVDVTSEIDGMVRSVRFRPGQEVSEGQVLVELNTDADVAQLHALEAAADLANTIYERDKKQLEIQSVSQATVDADAADLKTKRAQVAQQAAIVEKKTIRAAFAGKLGISTVNPGQYVKAGDKLVTLQSLDSLLVDFFLPQQQLSQVAVGQGITVSTDSYPGKTFNGKVTAINPKVDPDTRNVQIEATVVNLRHELLPGMYGTVTVKAGAIQRYLTVPQTAVSYNPYGETVFIVQTGTGPDGKPLLTVKQSFVTTGETRGDQVAILSGVAEGDTLVTSGQLKLRNGSPVVINNTVQPENEAAPKPVDQ
jgi:membrane fusion protein (multidrug efflux system)